MSGGGRRLRCARRSALLGGLTALAGCGGGSWFGESEDAPLPGKREAVLLIEGGLEPDPEIASLKVALPEPRRNPDWAQAGGVASHAPQHLEAADPVRRAWSADIGAAAGRRSRLLAAPVVAGGKVFTVDPRGEVAAFAAADGRRLWRAEPKDAEADKRLAAGGLAHAGGRVFVATGSGLVLALDDQSGAEVWRSEAKAPVRAVPTVVGDRFVLALTADNQLLALDAGSGEVLWRHSGLFEQTGILGGASPAAAGGIVVAAYSSGEVFGLELESGRPLWSETVLRPRRTVAINAIADIIGDPVIDRDRVLVAGVSGEMAALDVARGLRLWTADVTSTQMPWVAGDFVYVLTERAELVCLLRQNGRVRWVSPLGLLADPKDTESRRIRWSGPLLVTDRLLVAGSEGDLLSVSPYTGEVLGKARVGGAVSLPPVAADGTVYFLTDGGELLAFR